MTIEFESPELTVDGLHPKRFIQIHIGENGCTNDTILVEQISGGGLVHIDIDSSEDGIGDIYICRYSCSKHGVQSARFESPIPPTE
ncbi:MAG: hypothetical protein WA152_01065 [Microgenomates group bacterium]